jgi:hypothetical protein
MLLIPCPECQEPAEVCDQFILQSTDGPVEMATVRCSRPDASHDYRMALDRLPARSLASLVQQQHRATTPESRQGILIIPCPECQAPAEVNLAEHRLAPWKSRIAVATICCSRPDGHDLRLALDQLPSETLAAMVQQQREAREQPASETAPARPDPLPEPQTPGAADPRQSGPGNASPRTAATLGDGVRPAAEQNLRLGPGPGPAESPAAARPPRRPARDHSVPPGQLPGPSTTGTGMEL